MLIGVEYDSSKSWSQYQKKMLKVLVYNVLAKLLRIFGHEAYGRKVCFEIAEVLQKAVGEWTLYSCCIMSNVIQTIMVRGLSMVLFTYIRLNHSPL